MALPTRPFRESRVQRVIKEARASLMNPTRPVTPCDADRGFYMKGAGSRQGTPVILAPLEKDGWDGKRESTPSVHEAQVKAKLAKDDIFQGTPEVLDIQKEQAAPVPPPSHDEDQRYVDLNAMAELVDPTHAVETNLEALAKVNTITDSLVSTTQQEALSRHPTVVYLVSKIMKFCLSDLVTDTTSKLRASRVLLKCSLQGDPSVETAISVLYSSSKVKQNDLVFRSEGITECLLSILDGSWNIGPATLAAGVIKNISETEEEVQKSLGTLGAIRILTTVCREQIRSIAENQSDITLRQRIDFLIQATGCLRNLTLPSSHAHLFTKLGTVSVLYPAVFNSLKSFHHVVLNAARIIAKLSHTEDCKLVLERNTGNLTHLVSALDLYHENLAISLRLLYILGNLVQVNEETRRVLGSNEEVLEVLFRLFNIYCERDEVIMSKACSEAGWPAEVEEDAGSPAKPRPLSEECINGVDVEAEVEQLDDILTKLLRVVANLAISPEIGPRLSSEPLLVDNLVKLVQRKKIEKSEELVLNAVCCITNLSFYTDEGNLVLERQMEIADACAMLLLFDNIDAVTEVARAFGNFSRSQDMRSWMVETRVDEACSILLDHSDRQVVLAVTGVLLNFSSDAEFVNFFTRYDLMPRLSELLTVTPPNDYDQLATLLKLYYNLTDNSLISATQPLKDAALGLLSEAQTVPIQDQSPATLEFIEVATNLLELLDKTVNSEP